MHSHVGIRFYFSSILYSQRYRNHHYNTCNSIMISKGSKIEVFIAYAESPHGDQPINRHTLCLAYFPVIMYCLMHYFNLKFSCAHEGVMT